jgi:hypothetical protein
MKIRCHRGVVSFGSCFLLALFAYPTQAAPSKAEIDNYARANGFPQSDYPYYENVNECGGEGWSSTAIRDSWGKVSFKEACNNHDRCYMRLGSDLNACDDNFYKDARASCERDSYFRDPIFGKKIPDPATLSACYPIATTYYGAVRSVGWNWHNGAQKKAREYNNLVQAFSGDSNNGRFIKNSLSGKCIDVAGAPGNTNGAKLQLWDCETSGRNGDNDSPTDQKWTLTSDGFIRNTLSGKCIDVAGAPGTTNGASLILWDCETSGRNNDNGSPTDQKWTLTSDGFIRNTLSGKCIDVSGAPGTTNGASLILWDCETSGRNNDNGSPTDQRWSLQ